MRWLSAVIGLAFALSLGACMGKDGDQEYRPARFAANDQSFALEFSDPPWRVIKTGERALRLQVDSEIFGVTLGKAVPPMLILIASPVSLDEHLKDLIDPAQLSKLLEQAGVDKDKIPTNLSTIDTNALATLTGVSNFSSFVVPNSSFVTSTAGRTGASQGTSTQSTSATDKKKVEVPKVPEYLAGVDLTNNRDVAVAELNFLVRENKARIVDGLQYFKTDQGLSGVTYQLSMSPGIFVRNLYVPAKDYTLRVGVMSLFKLDNQDIHRLFLSVTTNAVAPTEPGSGKETP